MDRDDRELVRRCLQKDEDAWTQLAEAYARMVGTVIWRATGDHDVVEDLAQETFLRVFRGLPYFDQRAKLSTWIYTIAHRVAVDHRRQTGRRPAEANEAALRIDDQPSSGLNPELAATRNELDRIMRRSAWAAAGQISAAAGLCGNRGARLWDHRADAKGQAGDSEDARVSSPAVAQRKS